LKQGKQSPAAGKATASSVKAQTRARIGVRRASRAVIGLPLSIVDLPAGSEEVGIMPTRPD